MKGITDLVVGQIAKLTLTVVGKVILYGLAIIVAMGIVLIPLVIIHFLNDEDNVMWVSAIGVLFMVAHLHYV